MKLRAHFAGDIETALRPEAGFAASPHVRNGFGGGAASRVSYEETMPELYFGTDPLPTWEAICTRAAKNDLL